jgi:peptidoglycan/LPS O-acetylase OafA/YrhL
LIPAVAALHARSLAPLEKTRGFGMTPSGVSSIFANCATIGLASVAAHVAAYGIVLGTPATNSCEKFFTDRSCPAMNAIAALPIVNPSGERRSAAQQRRIPQLDGLRGIAVLLVVLYHFVPSMGLDRFGLQRSFHFGWCGVDLFFVLSGFLIGGILLDARESPSYFRTFYFRRFYRIFPLYYLWIFFYAVLAAGAFSHLPSSIAVAWPGARPVIVYALFLQNLVHKDLVGIAAAWLGPLWSLAVEEQFYLMMPLAVRFLPRRRLVQLLLAAIVLAPVGRTLAYAWIHSSAAWYVATPFRADALAMGVLLAIVLRDERWKARLMRNRLPIYGTIALLGCGVCLLAVWNPATEMRSRAMWGFSCLDAFFAAIMLLALLRPRGWWSSFCQLGFLRNAGGISYCVYIIHFAVLEICQEIIVFRFREWPMSAHIAGVLVAGLATWAIAKTSWRYLESPMIRRGHMHAYEPRKGWSRKGEASPSSYAKVS